MASGEIESEHLVLEATRALLRVRTPEEVVGTVISLISRFGGTTVPARIEDHDALPLDVSLGEGEPMLPSAPPDSVARMQLEQWLPRFIEDARIAVERMRRTDRLADDAGTDPLTGLLNRRSFDRLIARTGAGSVVAMIDLDLFKQVNDTFGHAAGDHVLSAFSRTLRDVIRVTDRAARLGGDEFVIVMPDTELSAASTVIERLQAEWARRRPYEVGVSVGIARVEGDGRAAVDVADSALYREKRKGRDLTAIV